MFSPCLHGRVVIVHRLTRVCVRMVANSHVERVKILNIQVHTFMELGRNRRSSVFVGYELKDDKITKTHFGSTLIF